MTMNEALYRVSVYEKGRNCRKSTKSLILYKMRQMKNIAQFYNDNYVHQPTVQNRHEARRTHIL